MPTKLPLSNTEYGTLSEILLVENVNRRTFACKEYSSTFDFSEYTESSLLASQVFEQAGLSSLESFEPYVHYLVNLDRGIEMHWEVDDVDDYLDYGDYDEDQEDNPYDRKIAELEKTIIEQRMFAEIHATVYDLDLINETATRLADEWSQRRPNAKSRKLKSPIITDDGYIPSTVQDMINERLKKCGCRVNSDGDKLLVLNPPKKKQLLKDYQVNLQACKLLTMATVDRLGVKEQYGVRIDIDVSDISKLLSMSTALNITTEFLSTLKERFNEDEFHYVNADFEQEWPRILQACPVVQPN
jgi:hypothetical protein